MSEHFRGQGQDSGDPGFEAFERRLDLLAERERSIPDDLFELRTLEQIRRASLEMLGEPMPIERAPRWRASSSWAVALAASVLVILTAAMFVWAVAPSAPPVAPRLTTAEPDAAIEVDEFIETVAWLDASLPEFSSRSNLESEFGTIDDLFEEVEQSLVEEEESI